MTRLATTSSGGWRTAGWLLVPVALFAGLVLGGWGPRRELDRANAEIARLRAAGGRGDNAVPLNVITGVVGIPARGAPRPAPAPAPEPAPAPPEVEHGPAQTPSPAHEPPAPIETELSLAERLEDARAAWAVRADIARNTFVARTGLAVEDVKRFDVIMAAMNLRLRAALERLAQTVAAGEDITAERGIRIVNELTGILTLTYDEMDRQLPPTWRAAAGTDFDLTDFIDPSVAEPLIPVESQLRNRPRFGPGRRHREGQGIAVEVRTEGAPAAPSP